MKQTTMQPGFVRPLSPLAQVTVGAMPIGALAYFAAVVVE
jgi:hypothetical protein